MSTRMQYIPAAILFAGCLLLLRITGQHVMPLAEPLDSIPRVVLGRRGTDQVISHQEQRVAGMTSYLLRSFGSDSTPRFSVYVGYYAYQTQGRTIHSPKNCLPGAGWEPLEATQDSILTPLGMTVVNRYVLANREEKAVVLYWYQGRGRVAANEYRVKLELLRDSALHGRSEEALVRVVVPVSGATDEGGAIATAHAVATELIPLVHKVLPT
jgi:EpsI family protein